MEFKSKEEIPAHAFEYVEKNDLKCLFDLNSDGGNEETRKECCEKTGLFLCFYKYIDRVRLKYQT